MNKFGKPESGPMKLLYGVGIVLLIIVIIVIVNGIRDETSAAPVTKDEVVTEVRPYETVQDVLTMFGEYNVDVTLINSMEGIPFVEESLDTTVMVGTQRVSAYIHTFSDMDTRDAWLDMSQGLDGVAVYRGEELWAISVDTDISNSVEVANQLADRLNGDVI